MKIIYGANYGRPTLDLNFARNKSLIDTISGQNLVTFSRSQANYRTTYVGSDGLIKYASANEPRFDHDPLTGECLGLLVEEQRQNLLTYSEQFDDGTWLKENGASVLSNSTVAPNGTFSADTIVESTSTTRPRLRTPQVNVVNGSSYVFSFYAKSAGRNFLQAILLNNTTTSVIDISTGQYVSGSTNVNVSPAGNGWFRVSIWGTFNQASGSYRSDIFLQSTSSTSDYTGDGVSGIYIWGAQLEVGSFPTSYIPTTGSTVTRSADNAEITGTNFTRWYNQSEGTVFHSGRYIGDVSGGLYGVGNGLMFTFTNSTLNTFTNQWSLGIHKAGGPSNPSSLSDVVFNGTTPVFSGVSDQLANNPVGSQMKSAAFIKTSTGEFGQVLNGGTIRSNSATSIPNWNQLSISTSYIGQVRCGHISRFTYYPTRLQNYQLQQITK